MRQGHTLSTALQHGHTRLPSRHMSGCDVRTRAHNAHLSMPHLLSAYRDVWVSEASRFPYLVPCRYAMRRTDARCLSLNDD